MNIQGFKNVTYRELQKELDKGYKENDAKDINLAVAIDIKSTQTIRNAFHTEEQMVSDELLTKLAAELNITLLIGWIGGKRNYYIFKN